MRLLSMGGARPRAKAFCEVATLLNERKARIMSELLKNLRIKEVIKVRKKRRHRDMEPLRLGRPIEYKHTKARRQ